VNRHPPRGPDSPEPGSPEDAEERARSRIPIVDKRVVSGEGSDREADLHGFGSGDAASPDPGSLSERPAAERLAADRLDQLLRLKADFENYRKRVIREQTDIVERASLRLVEKLLPVLDDFERGLEAARKEGAENIFRGLELVLTHLRTVLEAEGLERVSVEGSVFDPHQHEAVSSVPGDVDEPTVLEVVRPGYRVKGRTIRPALVHVSTPEETPAQTPAQTHEGSPEEGA
jgi:molecular chaperone GrpE